MTWAWQTRPLCLYCDLIILCLRGIWGSAKTKLLFPASNKHHTARQIPSPTARGPSSRQQQLHHGDYSELDAAVARELGAYLSRLSILSPGKLLAALLAPHALCDFCCFLQDDMLTRIDHRSTMVY